MSGCGLEDSCHGGGGAVGSGSRMVDNTSLPRSLQGWGRQLVEEATWGTGPSGGGGRGTGVEWRHLRMSRCTRSNGAIRVGQGRMWCSGVARWGRASRTSESRRRQRGGQRVGDGGVAVGQRVNEQVGELSRVLPEKFGFLTGFASLTLSRLTSQN
ncbi:hypothetical protein GQ55_2G206900 [Panicum hallii var. hallii]|uniref:Uncharacterized protein n=1 Tax=Panicum hallii var. hallii TaxID=1504633 RepID=A0A2T7EQT8_9POAL|nr:hypothetical protein GQ55_2G206900 [Panicum hallii var. hallii]